MFKHVPNFKLPDLQSVTTDNGRFYTTPEGNVYPSVTTVLGSTNNEWLAKWKERVGEAEVARISKEASTRGTAVHEIAEKYLYNDPNYKSSNPFYRMSFNQIKPFLDQHIGLIAGLELPLYSDKMRVAGRSDCVAKWDKIWSVIDFKTSKWDKHEDDIENYFFQTSCYAEMFKERTGIEIPQIVIVMTIDSAPSKCFVKKTSDYIEKFVQIRGECAL